MAERGSTAQTPVPPGTCAVFRFSCGEHGWEDLEQPDIAAQCALRAACEHPWTFVEPIDESTVPSLYEDDVTTLEEMGDRLAELIVDEYGFPEEAVYIPLDRLADKMRSEGWEFLGGTYWEFEGNHSDTEINVVLKKTP